MPVWDLQLVTFPGGLDTEQTEVVLAASTPSARRVRRSLRHILPNVERYHRRFLGPDDGSPGRSASTTRPPPRSAPPCRTSST